MLLEPPLTKKLIPVLYIYKITCVIPLIWINYDALFTTYKYYFYNANINNIYNINIYLQKVYKKKQVHINYCYLISSTLRNGIASPIGRFIIGTVSIITDIIIIMCMGGGVCVLTWPRDAIDARTWHHAWFISVIDCVPKKKKKKNFMMCMYGYILHSHVEVCMYVCMYVCMKLKFKFCNRRHQCLRFAFVCGSYYSPMYVCVSVSSHCSIGRRYCYQQQRRRLHTYIQTYTLE